MKKMLFILSTIPKGACEKNFTIKITLIKILLAPQKSGNKIFCTECKKVCFETQKFHFIENFLTQFMKQKSIFSILT